MFLPASLVSSEKIMYLLLPIAAAANLTAQETAQSDESLTALLLDEEPASTGSCW